MATIKEVAKAAGVSTATVSRVLNGNYPVSEDTEKRVLEAVKNLNYRINTVAKSLKMNKTNTIALVIPTIDNAYVMDVATGIDNIISDKGYTLTIYFTENDEAKEESILRELFGKRVDGTIIYSYSKNGDGIQKYIDQGMKILCVDGKVPNVKTACVVENNELMAYKLVSGAIKKGHRKIGILKGISKSSTAEGRYKGFLKALEENDIKFDKRYVVEGNFNRGTAHYRTRKMLEENAGDLPTLIFSSNNHMAEGALIAIEELGLKVPDDISVVSYGDITVPKLYQPRLTIVQQSPIIMGEKAASVLLESIEENKSLQEDYVIESKIIERKSVKMM